MSMWKLVIIKFTIQECIMKKLIFVMIPVITLLLAGCGGGSNYKTTRSSASSSASSNNCAYVDKFHGSDVDHRVRVSRNTVCNSYIIKLQNLSNFEKRCVVKVNGERRVSYLSRYNTKKLYFRPTKTMDVRYGCRSWSSPEQLNNKSSKVSYGMKYIRGKINYRFYNNTSSDRRCTITFKNNTRSRSFIVPGSSHTNWMNFGKNRTKSYRCKVLL